MRQKVRWDLGRGMDQKRAAIPCCGDRIKENTVAAVADSDDEICRLGSVFQRGRRGK
jgi:hypothetical protein